MGLQHQFGNVTDDILYLMTSADDGKDDEKMSEEKTVVRIDLSPSSSASRRNVDT